jgi:hypothetical protein
VRRGAVVRPWEADMVMVKDDGYREGGMAVCEIDFVFAGFV